MSTIVIKELSSTGSDLLCDSESYLSELSEEELSSYGAWGVPTLTQSLYSSQWCLIANSINATPGAYKVGYNVSYYLGKRFK